MFTEIGNQLRITDPSSEIISWCRGNLELDNPEYLTRKRMNKWLGNTAPKLYLYEIDGDTLVLPFGCLRSIMPYLDNNVEKTFKPIQKIDFGGDVPLYDYQEKAVEEMYHSNYGILQSAAGSGKTQMGIALATKFSERTLWLTHTKDLLNQSKSRAEQYVDPDKLGTITEGLVNIGETMTFATIQTMSRLDLSQYKDVWDVIIVDECHRVSGTPTAMTMFSHVLNSLRARHKYGLSATVHRADGMIKATYAYLGKVIYSVPEEAVRDRIMTVTINPVNTYVGFSEKFLNYDGTLNYSRLINYLTEDVGRNTIILKDLMKNDDRYNLILSSRVSHLNDLMNRLPISKQIKAAVIDGKTKKGIREQAIEDMRTGKNHYLFATYALAKEGLDIPRLDRLYLVTPEKDYAVVTQAVGRIARTFEGKQKPVVYDYVDSGIVYLTKCYKKRCSHYRKLHCEWSE